MPRDFGRWFNDWKPPAELPDDVRRAEDGGAYEAQCCRCKEWVPMVVALEEHEAGNYWCGRGPGCCP